MADGFAQGVSGMLDAATSLNTAIGQGFQVDYEGATQLANFVNGLQSAARNVLNRGHRVSQTPQLGSTPAANVYKPYLPTVATDQAQGALPNMQKLREQLDQATSNIQKSITAYEQADDGSRSGLVSIQKFETV